MALVPYTITAIERDVADADASGKQVVVGASCSMFIQPSDSVVLLYDDANGSNGSTAKTTNYNGQVTVYIEQGEYRLETNGISRFVQAGRADKNTTSALIASTRTYEIGDIVETVGFTTKGDGGGGSWVLTATTGTASQTPAQLGNALLNDANGNQWSLVQNSFNDIRDALNISESLAKTILNAHGYSAEFLKSLILNNDPTIPSSTTNTVFIRDVASLSGQSTSFQIQRFADVTTSTNPKGIRALTTIGAGVSSTEYAISGELENNSELNSAGATAISGTAVKNNLGNTFASHFQVKDTQGLASSFGGSIVGQEINIQANGVDDNKVRIGYDVIARTYQPKFAINGEGEFWAGIRIRNSVLGAEGGKWVNALLIQDGVSAIDNAVTIENSPGTGAGYGLSDVGDKQHGIRLLGNYGQSSLDIRPDGIANNTFLGGVSTVGQETANLNLGGKNSSGDRVSLGRVRSVLQNNTSASEVGRLDLDFKSAGVLTTGVQLSGNSSANPVFLRINGVLKQVTQGAIDSGGVGFRALIVQN